MSRTDTAAVSVEALAARFGELSLELDTLRERVASLERRLEGEEFEVVTEVASNEGASTTPEAVGAGYQVGQRRESIARNIGQWLRRNLAGDHRGSSGRGEIGLASRLYVVCRDIEGDLHNPPLIFFSWGTAKPWCSRNGNPGDSVFIGLPSKTEAEIAIRAAGLEVPAAVRRQ